MHYIVLVLLPLLNTESSFPKMVHLKEDSKIDVPAATVQETVAILRGIQPKYEIHHGVRILDSALVTAAQLASRYLTYRALPDSAVDLVDESAAAVAVARDSKPEELDTLERQLHLVDVEINALERDKDADSASRNV